VNTWLATGQAGGMAIPSRASIRLREYLHARRGDAEANVCRAGIRRSAKPMRAKRNLSFLAAHASPMIFHKRR
jgi:hypothetical protein